MFGNKIFPHILKIRKIETVKNAYGELQKETSEVTETRGFVNIRRTRILHEKHGVIEDLVYEALIPSNLSIAKDDEVIFHDQFYKVKEIMPVIDIYGKEVYKKILLEKKE
jgi:hypothetical protein